MRRVVVTQYGTEHIQYERQFVVEIPEDMGVDNLDADHLAMIADQAGVEWEDEDSTGVWFKNHEVECDVEELWGGEHLPVVKWEVRVHEASGTTAA